MDSGVAGSRHATALNQHPLPIFAPTMLTVIYRDLRNHVDICPNDDIYHIRRADVLV